MITSQSVTTVDSYRFLDGMTRRMIKSWVGLGTPQNIPWTPLRKPLRECTIAMLSTGGMALRTDTPFDLELERQDPWWSDPTYRVSPQDTKAAAIKVYHLHINGSYAEQDINCVLPLQRLHELAGSGEVGRVAQSHYSYMGYTQRPERLLQESVPAIVRQMRYEHVDAVVLVPV